MRQVAAYRSGHLIDVHPNTMLNWVQFSTYQIWVQIKVEKKNNDGYNTVHNKKNKETITCIDMTCLSTQHWLVLCKNKPKCSKTLFYDCLYYILLKMYSTLWFFYLHLAKNVQLQIFQAIWWSYKTKQNHPGMARSWLQPLNRGSRWMEVFFTVYIAEIFSGTWATEKTKMWDCQDLQFVRKIFWNAILNLHVMHRTLFCQE